MSTSTVQGRAVTGEPGGPQRGTGARVVRGLGAALLLVALVVGIPVGLWILGGPVWTGPVSLNRIISTLSSPDVTGSVLLGLVKIVGWIGWLTFAIAVVIEVVAALRGRHSPHVRGLGAQQRAAAVLVGAVITMLVAAPSVAPAMAAPSPVEAGRTGTVATAPVASDAAAPSGVSGATDKVGGHARADEAPSATYTVQPGDSLWRIAEQTLGDGARFKQIADLNYGVPQADGNALDAGHWIEPGWVLRLPVEASGASVETDVAATSTGADEDDPVGIAPSKAPTDDEADPDDSDGTVDVRNRGAAPESAEVIVESGDTLWGIAEEELGDGTKYPEVFEASRATEQPGGARLTDPDYILPGWTVTVPGAGEPTSGGGGEGSRTDDAAQRSPGADESADEPSQSAGPDASDESTETTPEDADAGQPDASESAAAAAGAAGKPDRSAPEDSAPEEQAPEQTAPSAEVTPEGAVEVEPDDIDEPGGAGNDVVERTPSGEQPSGEQPAGEAPAAPEPNRVAQNAQPKELSDRDGAGQGGGEREGTGLPDPADVGSGSAGLGGRDAEDPADKEPAPEETAEGNLVPQAPPAPRETPGPQYDEVTPEDLRNDPNLEPNESARQDGSPRETIPGEGLIADELMPQDEPEQPAEETSSGSGTTWGGDPASDSVVENGAEGLTGDPAEILPDSDVTATSGGAVTEEVLPDEMSGDEPVAGERVPEVAVESSPPVVAPVESASGAGSAPVDVAGATTAATAAAGTTAGGASLLDSATDVVSDVVDDLDESVGVRTAAGVGGLLAAGLLALVAVKRRRARKGRVPGETVVVPGPETPAGALERDLHTVEDPFGRDQVDRALRTLAQWHRERGLPLPGVRVARLKSGEFVELYLDRPADLPEPWASTTDRFVWQLAAADADAASRVGSGEAADTDGEAPYPALVTVGHDDEDTHLMLDLENLACLDIRGSDAAAQATLAALAIELATSLWADDLQVTVVGTLGELPGVVDTGRVRHVPSLAGIIRELEARAADVDRTLAQVGATSVTDARGRGLATDAWTPEILLVGERLGLVERTKLEGLVERVPGVGIAAVTSSAEVGDWVLDLTGELTNGDTARGILMPAYIAVRPQQLDAATYAQALALLADPETAPGPAWSRSINRAEPTLEEIPMDVVRAGAADSDVAVGEGAGLAPSPGYATGTAGGQTTSGTRSGSFAPWANAAVSVATPPLGTPVVPGSGSLVGPVETAQPVETPPPAQPEPQPERLAAPVVRVLGSVELAGTSGVELPSTHQRQATELIAFLAFNPGSRGSDISKALWPSREPNLATRRSAVSRARRWLGTDAGGYEYLPRYWSTDDGGQADLESAGYRLRGVRTDWHTFCDLVGPDLSQTPTSDLLAALDMVRGRPFEGVPLRKYAWAEQLMHTISSGVVDVSHEVARRALLDGDFAMARHASQVGRLADPVDERSWRNGIRAEIASGRRDAVGRLVDRLRDHLEQLAMEPEPDTEELLAQVDEQDRRRAADAERTPRG
ncbi:LysM peptidoglycan-binding domain-containing protein [Promicromonospora panici]|uniref:LysM peptidoglycan-binding domain-containing protein n=1 Tax=Promicromonospora panici TaxID=2219658 RepID=UPI00101CE3A6|nr:LysM peptidoglycan-binding domain-containing protein [Promicromonospora panici]